MRYLFSVIVLTLGAVPIVTNIFAWTHEIIIVVDQSAVFIGPVCASVFNFSAGLNTACTSFSSSALLVINILQLLTFSNNFAAFDDHADVLLQSMPLVMTQRFILNLRQLNHTSRSSNSDALHFSRFSVNFRIPSDFLGNIGEPLEHGQLEVMLEGGDGAEEELEDGPDNNPLQQTSQLAAELTEASINSA
ncbi:uncharacterized protein PHACADRAFT_189418 [Phanerochaete carnosa HHB-10118-sp]|uniref:Uncharacterized protein n=1 Tax=Phanerochaete carnosa (strain HHB-10118-sp) TaxID=650164 RepID=K5WM94_PHACS|nr:uncharacterized protein PHACADRAFT_189418 [Phanerochaete carnosa HHB-10118-sp]EKM60284.1 hypothetical protein PHACADRAFT_189418 [Phanerochaete carnosa HHB-10118-sp]